jgi:hypothetical protein
MQSWMQAIKRGSFGRQVLRCIRDEWNGAKAVRRDDAGMVVGSR